MDLLVRLHKSHPLVHRPSSTAFPGKLPASLVRRCAKIQGRAAPLHAAGPSRGLLPRPTGFTGLLGVPRWVGMQAVNYDSLMSIDANEAPALVSIENDEAKDYTVITIEAQDQEYLLIRLSGAFNSAGIEVVSATITSEEGMVKDVFCVRASAGHMVGPRAPSTRRHDFDVRSSSSPSQTSGNMNISFLTLSALAVKRPIPPEQFDSLQSIILRLLTSSSRSNKPSIYGIVAAAEVERLRPISSSLGPGDTDEVESLELAAAEMATAAAQLVAMEREIMALKKRKKEGSKDLVKEKEAARGRKQLGKCTHDMARIATCGS
eukprot:gene8899-3785_t